MPNLKLAKPPKIEVTLDHEGQKVAFKMKPVTMEVEDALDDCSREIRRINENPDSKPLERTTAIAAQLDVLLLPVPVAAGDVPRDIPPPSEILLAAYEAGQVEGIQIRKLVDDMVTQARPT